MSNNEKWKRLAELIIEKNGFITCKDFKETGIPVGYFNELCMRSISHEQLVKNAKAILERMERNEY